MVQDQLVDYVSSQMKLGVSREAIKSALVSAGWLSADVEDTLKKVEGSAPAQSGMKPMQPFGEIQKPAMSSSADVGKRPESQTIRVSDLVSSTNISSPVASSGTTMKSEKPAMKMEKSQSDIKSASGNFETTTRGGGKGMMIMGIVCAVLVIGLGGLSWYFYSQNSALAGKISDLNGQSTSVNSQLSALQASIDASTTDYASQIESLTAANTDLELNLSFYAAPVGSSSSDSAPVAVTITGSLGGGGKALYTATTPRGAKIFITNSSDAKLGPQFKTFLGDTVQLVGTYVPGSDSITVTSVTNLSPAPAAPAPASTTTMTIPSSTPSSTASSTN